MAVLVARSLADPTGEDGPNNCIPPAAPTFKDALTDNKWSWCYKHVEFLAVKVVGRGYPDGTYRPAQDVTRDQLAVYLVRAFGLTESLALRLRHGCPQRHSQGAASPVSCVTAITVTQETL
jgi:hypothetical protein